MQPPRLLIVLLVALWMSTPTNSKALQITTDNFVRVASDIAMQKAATERGAFGKFSHSRTPTKVEAQPIIRMNQDTLYSSAVFDLSNPVTITLPSNDGRYQSLQIINQDHYTTAVYSKPGSYQITQEQTGSRYAMALVRTFINTRDSQDVKIVNQLQDLITVEQEAKGELDLPAWDYAAYKQLEAEILKQGREVFAKKARSTEWEDPRKKPMFGKKDEVDPKVHLLGTAFGWGGLPPQNSYYSSFYPDADNADKPHNIVIKDVPVSSFWSITMYNKDGYLEKNTLDSYSFNNMNAKKSDDGSTQIFIGNCEQHETNCLPVTEGWNYLLRFYGPQESLLDGSWRIPQARITN